MKVNRRILGLIHESCNGYCYYCGVDIPPFSDWQIEHMQPQAKGGSDTFYNLVAACRFCNSSKGNRTVEEFRQAIIRRALNQVTSARETLGPFAPRPETRYEKAVTLLTEAEECLAGADIVFFGERTDLPRNHDALFSEQMDTAMQEFDESEGDDPTDSVM